MTYGFEVHQRDDVMLDTAKRMSKFGQANVLPGALLVNYLPFCMHSRLFRKRIDLLCALQYATFPNGCHGFATNHWHALAIT